MSNDSKESAHAYLERTGMLDTLTQRKATFLGLFFPFARRRSAGAAR